MTAPILVTEGLSKRFGGLCAVDEVSLRFVRGEVHAILGPNGAGKSTLVNLLSGDLLPTSGSIRFEGRDITRLPAYRRSQLGIGRSYQKTNIFPSFTCFENCWLAAQSRLPTSMRFLRPARRLKLIWERTARALELCGLAERAQTVASAMSYGEQRQLEIGMVLATEPRLLLLDEPMAGMGKEESERVVALLRSLAGDYTLILIEHDMDAVFALADALTVMVNGRVLDSGPVLQVRNNIAVQEAYLGSAEGVY
ncbi:MAG TPA: ABC transporter ATP-binding protein [Candidatus Competibacteraceae bacterium]|nr:ABC transporter ATP-binding protein [Candidatus Competibacteraceae bacterium]